MTINPWMMLPFGVLLGMIALGPVLFPAWWLRHYPKVAIGLGAVTLAYYFFGLNAGHRIGETAHEYVSFIALIGSLYVVSGGIHINVGPEATPWANVIFLLAGAVLANVLGTTGASMLLIRPWLRMNQQRVAAHHVVFFIFIVSNVGGCLTPIGDPPLFLGYLAGIPFWWVAEHCLAIWAVAVGMLLAMFWVVDWRSHQRSSKALPTKDAMKFIQWKIEGWTNIIFLGVILAAVFLNHPPFLREGLMVAAALGSYITTRMSVHEANQFDFHPIREVAVLFIGIFATMMPALDWLQGNAGRLDQTSTSSYFWGCGLLSSALDNAPTYLCFLKAVSARFAGVNLVGDPMLNGYVVAISVAAVFFGANTYIGNGPNLMVKSIADRQHAHAPTFLGYFVRFTLPFMLPVLLVVWWLFFRH